MHQKDLGHQLLKIKSQIFNSERADMLNTNRKSHKAIRPVLPIGGVHCTYFIYI